MNVTMPPGLLSHAELDAELEWRMQHGDDESDRFVTLHDEYTRRAGEVPVAAGPTKGMPPVPDTMNVAQNPSLMSSRELDDEIDWRIANGDEDSPRFQVLYDEYERRS